MAGKNSSEAIQMNIKGALAQRFGLLPDVK
jgi:hypothetical protein